MHALAAARAAAAAGGGEALSVRVSATLRPLLLAALLEDERGLAGRPALIVSPDDRSARDLAADLRAYLAPRRVRFYPSRGTGYASHVSPPPHLVGLRIDALEALAQRSRTPIVVAERHGPCRGGPGRLACARPASHLAIWRGARARSRRPASSSRRGYERVEQVEERGQFALRGRHPRCLSGDRGAGRTDRAVRR